MHAILAPTDDGNFLPELQAQLGRSRLTSPQIEYHEES